MPPRTGFPLLALTALPFLAYPAYGLPLADSVTSFTGGRGFGVEEYSDGSYTGAWGEGEYDPAAVTALDGAVLGLGGATGTPGTITMRFSTGKVIDGSGADLRLYDTHFFQDGFSLDVSADGSGFTHAFLFTGDLGVFNCSLESPCITNVDISGAGLDAISYVRIAAAGSGAQGFPEAYTLDAVEALHFRSAAVVTEPGTLALLGLATAALAIIRRRNGTDREGLQTREKRDK